MTRRSLSANEAIDEIDSPVDGLGDGSLSIPSETTGYVTGINRTIDTNRYKTHSCSSKPPLYIFQMFGDDQMQ